MPYRYCSGPHSYSRDLRMWDADFFYPYMKKKKRISSFRGTGTGNITQCRRLVFFPGFRIRIKLFTMWIRILLLIKVMWICDHWSTDHPGLQERPRLLRLFFEPLKLMKFDLNADPDPASKNNADPYGSGSATLFLSIVRYWASYNYNLTMQEWEPKLEEQWKPEEIQPGDQSSWLTV